MFRDLVNQISATNVKLKQMNYTSVESRSSIFGGGNKPRRPRTAKEKEPATKSKDSIGKDLDGIGYNQDLESPQKDDLKQAKETEKTYATTASH